MTGLQRVATRAPMYREARTRARPPQTVRLPRRAPPLRRISQQEFREETRRTGQVESVQQFRRTRFISRRSKISSGCLILGIAIAAIVIIALDLVGVEGNLLLIPSLVLGGATGMGVWVRAYTTGAMIEDDE